MNEPESDAMALLRLFPSSARPLLQATGADLIGRMGLDVVREIVKDVLSGKNVRDSTEMLTRRRIATLNAAALVMLVSGRATLRDFDRRLPGIAASGLAHPLPKRDRWILLWVLGLTEKAFQNVLRDDPGALKDYAEQYRTAIEEVAEQARVEWGDVAGRVKIGDASTNVTWRLALWISGTLGSQTLAVRGSEKSLYGKLFERLVLGSLLHLLGFQFIRKSELQPDNERVFWLSSREEKRESDATLLFEAGHGVRFDIGFIGHGNPEISLDKVSRFERQIELGPERWFLATFIIVDTIPRNSRILELAREIDGTVIQMSMGYWPKTVAIALHERIGYDSPLVAMEDNEVGAYLEAQLTSVPFDQILAAVADPPRSRQKRSAPNG